MKILTSLNGDRSFLLTYMADNSVAAEIGVWRGEFSAAVLRHKKIKEYNLIDPWISYDVPAGGVLKESDVAENAENVRYQEVLTKFKNEIDTGQVKIYKDYALGASVNFEDNKFDWIYVDGGHTYEDVKLDLDTYVSKVKVGGYIMGDDYNPDAWQGVVQAVDEFRTRAGIQTVSLDNCQFVLRKLA